MKSTQKTHIGRTAIWTAIDHRSTAIVRQSVKNKVIVHLRGMIPFNVIAACD